MMGKQTKKKVERELSCQRKEYENVYETDLWDDSIRRCGQSKSVSRHS